MEKQELTAIDKQIKKILEGLHAFKDPRDRQLVIENIPVDLRRRFHGNERPVDMASVFTDLFKRYSRHRDALLEAINYVEKNSDDFEHLDICVNELNKAKWKDELINLLSKEIGEAEEQKSLYVQSLIKTALMPSKDRMNWEKIITDLLDISGHRWEIKDYSGKDLLPPLLKFIWIVTRNKDKSLGSKIEELAKNLLGIKEDLIEIRDEFIEKFEQNLTSFELQVALIPINELEDTFSLAIFYRNRDGEIIFFYQFEKKYLVKEEKEIESDITNWLRTNLFPKSDNLEQKGISFEKTIAFFLPDKLLHLPIDEWAAVTTPFDEQTFFALGTEYSVIFKSIERYTNTRYSAFKDKLRKRLESIKSSRMGGRQDQKVHFFSDHLKNHWKGGAEVYKHFDSLPEINYLVIDLPIDNKNVDLLKGIVAAGVPFVFWLCKQPSKPLCPKKYLKEYLSNCDESLLEQIKEIRKKIREEGEKTHINVSVLWENKDHSKEIGELVKMATGPLNK